VARTRSKSAHEKVLKAALRLIGDRGIEGTSMDAIAAESGVSKATLYKHWANKDALLLEVVANMMENIPDFDSGDPRADLRAFLHHIARSRKREELGRLWPRVIGHAVANPDFAHALRRFTFEPRRAQITAILERAMEQGELAAVDHDIAMDMLIGPIMHRRFVDETAVPLALADRVVDYFWRNFAPPKPLSK
jgi:AcrR family transcriptional regulator